MDRMPHRPSSARLTVMAILLLMLLPCPAQVLAEENAAEHQKQKKLWKARIELSYTQTSGNTETESFGGKLDFTHEARRDRYYLKAESLYREDQDVEVANRFSTETNWEHTITKGLFTVLTAGYLTDKYSGYNSRVYGGPGLGYDIIKTETHHLKTLLSAVYYADDYTGDDPDEDEYWSGRAALRYRWEITKGVTFKENIEYTAKLQDTHKYFADSETALEAAINSYLSLGLNYTVKYQNEPPVDIQHTDRTFMSTLIFTL